MRAGNGIKVPEYCFGHLVGWNYFIVEEFRHCLGIFQSDQHRKAGNFTPLCELYERGPDSENSYISNYGEYVTNMVQAWIDVP